MTAQWEYTVMRLNQDSSERWMSDGLNQLGAQGWEAVSMIPDHRDKHLMLVLFKRAAVPQSST